MGMNKIVWAAIVLIVVLAGGWFLLRAPATIDEVEVVEPMVHTVALVNHIQADLPEQDVYVESDDDPTLVVRVEGEEALSEENAEKMLYAAEEPIEHDPFKLGENPLGPFPKGEELGITLGEWLSASGSGIYTESDEGAELVLSMAGLVPDGVYTVWCSELKLPPEPAITDQPCGAPDGSENIFTAAEDGSATFQVMMDKLPPSTAEKLSVVALAYHSDGETYGEEPGDFGLVTHVHIFWMLPPTEGGSDGVE